MAVLNFLGTVASLLELLGASYLGTVDDLLGTPPAGCTQYFTAAYTCESAAEAQRAGSTVTGQFAIIVKGAALENIGARLLSATCKVTW